MLRHSIDYVDSTVEQKETIITTIRAAQPNKAGSPVRAVRNDLHYERSVEVCELARSASGYN